MDDETLQFYRSNAAGLCGLGEGAVDAADAVFSRCCRRAARSSNSAAAPAIIRPRCWRAGFAVRATDGSPEMAEIASRRLGHPVETMLFDELDAQRSL